MLICNILAPLSSLPWWENHKSLRGSENREEKISKEIAERKKKFNDIFYYLCQSRKISIPLFPEEIVLIDFLFLEDYISLCSPNSRPWP